jgi:hypothetical protein
MLGLFHLPVPGLKEIDKYQELKTVVQRFIVVLRYTSRIEFSGHGRNLVNCGRP